MEANVSNLVEHYERGALTRRQLVAGLAALAMTAKAGYSQEPQAPVQAKPLTEITAVDINHVGINVSDVARSIDWYSTVFGLDVMVKSKDVAVLGFRGIGAAGPTFVFRTSPKPEVNHLMFGIHNYNEAALGEYLKAKGLTLRNDVLSFHVKDPDGIDVQVGDTALHPSETVLKHS
jgi:catechol 2,3-dioxygenase-like lactoylglutathione lyase family enzyme